MGGAPKNLLLTAAVLLLFNHFGTALAQSHQDNITTVKEYLSYSFSSFDDSDRLTNLTVSKEASIAQGALQITPDTLNKASYIVNKSGRVLFSTPFKLWDYSSSDSNLSNSKYVASFNTSFTINIYRQSNTIPGEGFAFLIAPSLDPPPSGSDGGFLGLTNSTLNGNAANHFIAVELDTVKQSYDPDDNHVGLDINGVVSNVTRSLSPLGIQIAPVNATNYTLWVDYDGVDRHVWVYMALEGRLKPSWAVLNASLDLGDIVVQKSFLGFSASTGSDYQLNCVLAWNLTVEKLPDDSVGKKGLSGWKLGLAIGIPCVGVAAIAGLLLGLYLKRKKVGVDPSLLTGTLRSLPGMPREFEFKELRKATSNFDERMKLGQGGFGSVYKGVLLGDNGEEIQVAVKKFSRANTKGQEDFLSELSIINRLRHKHLVRLVGWCHKNGVLLLVYDYMPNGSLDQHLFREYECDLLSWDRRYNIITGVASALHYLHNEYDQKVVHRDLKASNIMLDSSFNARLGDFGLARALESDKTSYAELELNGVPGTLGYIAPECFHTGKATRESDVFGFGAVILEVVCGRRPRYESIDGGGGFQFLVDWVWRLHREGRLTEAVDARLEGNFVAADAERLLLLGLACSHPIPGERPKMPAIVQIISKSMPPPAVPPFKPAFVWPAEGDGETTSSSRLTSTTATSSYYGSSSGLTHNYLSTEGHVSPV
ncbi:probable L-type lectin-domain containing receptor kinase S.5 [Typha latifolia]|uniref:probable L-type lectin-domain containing receptor kinase S.5 n=1 Tax=Typha latifolia TaxID=4733 RepID=UPI003C2EB339